MRHLKLEEHMDYTIEERALSSISCTTVLAINNRSCQH
jgi:hypothetical protein